jgi:lipid-binding SYLF domain-containing protein
MRISRRVLASLGLAALAVVNLPAVAQEREDTRLRVAAEVLDELRTQRDQQIPERLLQRAYGVAVIPSVTKLAFFLGGRRGSGVLTVRDAQGRFGNPIFVNLTGGSVGWQFGAQETDVVLVFTTRRGIEGIAGGKVTLGAGASVAAGPVGRQAEAAAGTSAEVYSYSRARGLFAGVALDGTALTMDNKGNSTFYGRSGVLPSEIMSGAVTTSSENARKFLAALTVSTGENAPGKATATAAAPAGAAPASTPPASAPPAPAAGGEVKTFPMEDPAPGKEPGG